MTLGYPEWIGKFYKINEYSVNESTQNQRYGYNNINWPVISGTTRDVVGMYNGIMPRHMLPGLYKDNDEMIDQDEGVIAPYSINTKVIKKGNEEKSDAYDDALKMVSFDQITSFRNKIQPIIAYTSQTLNSGQYPALRASYNKRQEMNQPIIYQGKRCVISPVVLATTDDDVDSYQDYNSGDLVYGMVREHFPSGYTWWYMKQVLGGRYTRHPGGTYHMDDTGEIYNFDDNPEMFSAEDQARGITVKSAPYGVMSGGSGGMYTIGSRTIAKCAVFIHGLLPLDKQILAAYLIVGTSSVNPSKDPVGLSWSGGPAMYHHYHGMAAALNPKDYGGLAGYKGQPHFYDGRNKHFHGTAGHKDGYYNDVGQLVSTKNSNVVTYNSDDIAFQDESAYRLWGYDSHSVVDDRYIYYEDKFEEMIGNLCGLYDQSFYRIRGIDKKDIYSKEDDQKMSSGQSGTFLPIGTGYDNSSFQGLDLGLKFFNINLSDEKIDRKFQYVILDDDKNLVYKYTPSEVWKTGVSSEIQEKIDSHTYDIQFTASDGTEQGTVSYNFTQTDSVVKQIANEQSQGITGYFNMDWTNTKGYSYGKYKVDYGESYVQWNAPVIFQDGSPSPSNNYSGTTISEDQTGSVPRLIDITETVRKDYNARVYRKFSCKGGATFYDVRNFAFYDVKGKMDEDVNLQNKQIPINGSHQHEYLLNDNFTYPSLEDLQTIPTVSPSGDKYELSSKISQVIAQISDYNYSTIAKNYDGYYSIYPYESQVSDVNEHKTHYKNIFQSLGGNLYQIKKYEDFEKVIKIIFSEITDAKFKRVSNKKIMITSEKGFVINNDVSEVNNKLCYSMFNLIPGEYSPGQNRIVDVTDYVQGSHPKNLLYDKGGTARGKWEFDTYENKYQEFVIDLLRAPLCKQQRNWRNKGASTNYSNAKCPNPSCKAYDMGCGVAANMSGKHFDEQVGRCPICNASLQGAKGVITTPGDGIKTYKYDKLFSPDPFIGDVFVKPMTVTVGNTKKTCIFSVMYKENGGDVWKVLNSYELTVEEGKYKYKIQKKQDKKGKNDPPKIRARFLKIRCYPIEYSVKEEYKVVENRGYQIIVQRKNGNDFSNMGKFSFAGLPATFKRDGGDSSNDSQDVYINSAQIVAGTNNTQMKIALDRSVQKFKNQDQQNNYTRTYTFTFYPNKYTGGISDLLVAGYHYKTQEGEDAENSAGSGKVFLKMTDTYDVFQTYLTNSGTKYELYQVPIQIIRVGVGNYDTQSIILEQANSPTTELKWETEQKTYTVTDSNGNAKSYIYKKIKGGNYYYDFKNGYICLPLTDQNNKPFSDFQKTLSDAGIKQTFKPDSLFVSYWGGNGKSITLKAQAAGNGPSYMLQKNAICQLESNDNIEQKYSPVNRKFCKIIDAEGNEKSPTSYPWIVYNNIPSTLSIQKASLSNDKQGQWKFNAGQFRIPSFNGSELIGFGSEMGTKVDDRFISLFGKNCTRCMGICTTQVTLIGPPDAIISGDIIVKAPKEKVYKIKTGNGTGYTYTQRTGGIEKGIIICSVSPSKNNVGRVTKCYTKPKLVIFAKQAKKYDKLT